MEYDGGVGRAVALQNEGSCFKPLCWARGPGLNGFSLESPKTCIFGAKLKFPTDCEELQCPTLREVFFSFSESSRKMFVHKF